MKLDELAKECARILAKKLSARVDLHTTTFAGSFARNSEVMVPAFKVSVLRATGAGDAWNAGNIFGDALGLPDSCRLTLANAVAAYYISSPAGEHPALPKLVDFCSKQLSKIKD
jgi:sugar/nucleoside kinase (ribokinase family)